MPTLRPYDGIHVLDLGDGENRFSPTWLDAFEEALDVVVAEPAPLVTIGGGKFYSNGLDLDWLSDHMDQLGSYTARIEALLARILTLPVPTTAAVNGHAFGGGAMLAIAHDWRVMREDRGYFCFPEVDIQIPFTPGMAALIQAKLTPQAATNSMTTGRRFPGPGAVAAGLVDGITPASDLVEAAISRVAPYTGKHPDTLAAIKSTMYTDAVAKLTDGAL
ncbi:enoyl-CoA hydratase [Aeromicrobium sp. PE09-221]|uniref:enoyl-CoA hydratase-related protein n=1 Tax=Aeromicrobium sp. PE09-221 TaxID=1898043 RepID=UPI000B3EDE6E|nr:enoyl-CoA hydratase-related protein [Aeromicrobium sp. PE09-221]OUZ09474.1 enoyl-CoA hydratase [Aeromicrobium sp. PE09-221]